MEGEQLQSESKNQKPDDTYECEKCEFTCSNKNTFSSHMARKHPKILNANVDFRKLALTQSKELKKNKKTNKQLIQKTKELDDKCKENEQLKQYIRTLEQQLSSNSANRLTNTDEQTTLESCFGEQDRSITGVYLKIAPATYYDLRVTGTKKLFISNRKYIIIKYGQTRSSKRHREADSTWQSIGEVLDIITTSFPVETEQLFKNWLHNKGKLINGQHNTKKSRCKELTTVNCQDDYNVLARQYKTFADQIEKQMKEKFAGETLSNDNSKIQSTWDEGKIKQEQEKTKQELEKTKQLELQFKMLQLSCSSNNTGSLTVQFSKSI